MPNPMLVRYQGKVRAGGMIDTCDHGLFRVPLSVKNSREPDWKAEVIDVFTDETNYFVSSGRSDICLKGDFAAADVSGGLVLVLYSYRDPPSPLLPTPTSKYGHYRGEFGVKEWRVETERMRDVLEA